MLQSDNDPNHLSGKVKLWFITHKIDDIKLPAPFLDINSIQNCWCDTEKSLFRSSTKKYLEILECRLINLVKITGSWIPKVLAL